jgi:hypothetical protein
MLIFGVNILFYYLYFSISEVKDKIEAHIALLEGERKDDLQLLTIPKADFRQDDEIWYEGQMYDVSSYTIVGDSVQLQVWHDVKEESLVAYYSARMNEGKDFLSGNATHLSKIHKTYQVDYKFFQNSRIEPWHKSIILSYIVFNDMYYKSYFITVLVPPPESMNS